MNWGGFAGGFAQGFGNGVSMGRTLNDAIKQNKIDNIRAEGIAEAQAARKAEIDASVKDTQAKAADDAATQQPATAGPKTGEAAPDTADVQTYAVPAPGTVQQQPLPAPVNSPQSAVDAAPAQPAPVAPPVAAAPVPQAQPTPAAAPVPDASAAPAPPTQPVPMAAEGMAGAPKRYTVNGKGFDDPAAARKYAESSAPTLTEFMRKTMVPKMQEAYIAQGDPEKAAAWGKWASDSEHEEHAKTWAKTYQAAQAGDIDAAAAGVIKMYKNYDDGISLVSSEKVKDKDGNVTGFNVKLKTDGTGEVRSQFIDKKALTEMGLAALSPVQMFEQVYKRQQAADQLGAKAAIDAQNDARTMQRDLAKQGMIEDRADKRTAASDARRAAEDDRRHGYKLEELTTAEQLKTAGYGKSEKAKLQAKVDILKDNGMPADAIKAIIPNLIGVDGYKKTTDPAERRALITSDLMKNSPSFANQKDPAKQAAQVDQLMGVIYGPQAAPAPRPGVTTVPNPTQSAAPAPPAAKPKGVPVWDSKTGQIIYK